MVILSVLKLNAKSQCMASRLVCACSIRGQQLLMSEEAHCSGLRTLDCEGDMPSIRGVGWTLLYT